MDELLVDRGLCETRTQAKALILAGQVWSGTQRLDKAGKLISATTEITLKSPIKYVGRGGLKMENFLKESNLDPSGMRVLDLGASTGGFTDCLLQHGAREALCVDVGHGQLHYKLRTDARVRNFEKLNLRHLKPEDLENSPFPLVVMDLSFISLRKVLVRAWQFVAPEGKLVALIKPQFECSREEASEGKGVIRSEEIRNRIKNEIIEFARENLYESTIFFETEAKPKGTDGNLEFFVGWKRSKAEGP